jgi:predicted DNA-binding WGR domain protein
MFPVSLNCLDSSCIFAKYNDAPFSICHQCGLPILQESVLFVHFDADLSEKVPHLHHLSCLLKNEALITSISIQLKYLHPNDREQVLEEIRSAKVSVNLTVTHDSKKAKHVLAENLASEELWWALWNRLNSLPAHVVRDLLFWNDVTFGPFQSQTALCSVASNLLTLGIPDRCHNCGKQPHPDHMSWKCSGQFSAWSSCLTAFFPDLVCTKHPRLPQSFQEHFQDFVFTAHHAHDFSSHSLRRSHHNWILKAYLGSDAEIESALAIQAANVSQHECKRYLSPRDATAHFISGIFHECSLDPATHFVIGEGGRVLSATLVYVDALGDENKFFKLQVVVLGMMLQDSRTVFMPDHSNFKCYLVCVSGRIGHGAHSRVDVAEFKSADAAVSKFYALYAEKTGIWWKDWQHGAKIECKYFHLDLVESVSCDANVMQGDFPTELEHGCHFSISESVWFYSKYTIVFPKMVTVVSEVFPFGPISFQAFNHAQTILQDLQSCISQIKGNAKLQKIIDLSNQYFSIVPRRFYSGSVPLLSSCDLISLENAFIHESISALSLPPLKHVSTRSHRLNLFSNFETEFLEPSGMMFASIARCIKQSHGATHSGWSMEVVDVLQVHHSLINRRFEKWLSLNNHQLLWHGTRKTNLGGILQHGLRIAPSEISPSGQVVIIDHSAPRDYHL